MWEFLGGSPGKKWVEKLRVMLQGIKWRDLRKMEWHASMDAIVRAEEKGTTSCLWSFLYFLSISNSHPFPPLQTAAQSTDKQHSLVDAAPATYTAFSIFAHSSVPPRVQDGRLWAGTCSETHGRSPGWEGTLEGAGTCHEVGPFQSPSDLGYHLAFEFQSPSHPSTQRNQCLPHPLTSLWCE